MGKMLWTEGIENQRVLKKQKKISNEGCLRCEREALFVEVHE